MLQLRVDDQLDELLELGPGLPENQFQILLAESLSLHIAAFLKESEHVRPCDMSLARSVDPLKEHHWAEAFHEALLKVKSHVEKVRLSLHQSLFVCDQSQKELAEQKLNIATLI